MASVLLQRSETMASHTKNVGSAALPGCFFHLVNLHRYCPCGAKVSVQPAGCICPVLLRAPGHAQLLTLKSPALLPWISPITPLHCPMSVLGTCGAGSCRDILFVRKPGHCNYGFPKFLAELKRTPNMLRLGNTWGGGERGSARH